MYLHTIHYIYIYIYIVYIYRERERQRQRMFIVQCTHIVNIQSVYIQYSIAQDVPTHVDSIIFETVLFMCSIPHTHTYRLNYI